MNEVKTQTSKEPKVSNVEIDDNDLVMIKYHSKLAIVMLPLGILSLIVCGYLYFFFYFLSQSKTLSSPESLQRRTLNKEYLSTFSSTDINKPFLDSREYRYVTLPSGLSILLISDPSTSKSGAGISVEAGSFKDNEIPGLAHLCEHMLFMGSRRFPDSGAIHNFVKTKSGTANASTKQESTNFYLEISETGFDHVLDLFVAAFEYPLFDTNWITKEIEAVQSEYEKDYTLDIFKKIQLLKTHSKKDNPFSIFNIGGTETFTKGIDLETLQSKLRSYYETFYTTANMKVVLLCTSLI